MAGVWAVPPGYDPNDPNLPPAMAPQVPSVFVDPPPDSDANLGPLGMGGPPTGRGIPSVFSGEPRLLPAVADPGAAPQVGPLKMVKPPTEGGVPQVFAPPPEPEVHPEPTPVEGQLTEANDELKNLQAKDQPYDYHQHGFLRNVGHVLAGVGNIAGDIVAPSVMTQIPGTFANREATENNLGARLQSLEQQATDERQKAALTAFETQRPEIEQSKVDQKQQAVRDRIQAQAAAHGQTVSFDNDGVPTFTDNPDSAAYQATQVHEDVERSQQALNEATQEVKLASIDPNSAAYRLAVMRARTAQVNAAAAVQRAQAYYGNYLQHAYNKGLDGQTLPGAPQIENDNGDVSVVGSTNAAQAVKGQANVAQFNDVHGALDNLEQTATDLVHSGGSLNSPAIAYALQHAEGTPSQFIQSLDKANLTPQERAYVISVQAAHENIQALRKAAGGTATDSAVEKLDQLIPNGSTPDLNYLLAQTKQIRATAERLGKGVTTVTGGASMRGGHSNKQTPESRSPSEPSRPANVPANYKFDAHGPRGAGWYKPKGQ